MGPGRLTVFGDHRFHDERAETGVLCVEQHREQVQMPALGIAFLQFEERQGLVQGFFEQIAAYERTDQITPRLGVVWRQTHPTP